MCVPAARGRRAEVKLTNVSVREKPGQDRELEENPDKYIQFDL